MIAIAESGSSKTNWVILEGSKKVDEFITSGFNPYVQSREQISEIVKNEVHKVLKDKDVSDIFFYGAGCSSEENIKLMYSCFKSFFNMTEPHIQHDLLASCRALWHNEKGIAAILGTGSNSCVYDGQDVLDNMPALGFILGDEGSGAHMGKQLVIDFIYKKQDSAISEKLRIDYKLDKDYILDKVYKKPTPNRWLASFAPFIRDNTDNEYIHKLVMNAFRAFFEYHICCYPGYQTMNIAAVGSVAYHFQDYLQEVAKEYGCILAKVIKNPIEELVKYHSPKAVVADQG